MAKSTRSRYEQEWQKRQLGEERDRAESYYPDDAANTPPSISPRQIDEVTRDYSKIQEIIQGHLYIPYYHLPPYHARFFDSVDRRTVAANTTEVILTTTIPFANAVLRWFGNDVEDSGAWGNLTWRILINRQPASCWDNVTRQLGTIAAPTPVFLNLQLSDVITIGVINASLTTGYVALTRIKGWYW